MHKIGGGGAFTGTSQQNMFAFYCEWFPKTGCMSRNPEGSIHDYGS